MAALASEHSFFAQALLAQRDRRNSQFAAAHRRYPHLEADAFSQYLRDTLAPIVNAVAEIAPAETARVTEVLYELSLELLGQELLGPAARDPALTPWWRRLLTALAGHIARAPQLLVAALTNALLNIAQTPEARPGEWVGTLTELVPLCPDPATLLAAGQVLAWRAGLAHYRSGALALCRTLPPALAAATLGLPPAAAEPATLAAVVERLGRDCWLAPAAALTDPPPAALRLVRRAGAFRGFGGLFQTPPTVSYAGQFAVRDTERAWVLTADRFGATFHPIDPASLPPSPGPPSHFRVLPEGRVRYDGREVAFPELIGLTSWATDGVTLAATVELSHAVLLFARAAPPEPAP
jgi:hypothetical protein